MSRGLNFNIVHWTFFLVNFPYLTCLVVVVGFNPTVYNISEDAGVVTLKVERRGATAQRFTVTLSTRWLTAASGVLIHVASLTFSHGVSSSLLYMSYD